MLVVCELFLVHTTHLASGGFVIHLTAQELLVILIDTLNLSGETLLFKLVILLVGLPDNSLLIVEGFLGSLTSLFLLHLTGEEQSHLFLLFSFTLLAALIFKSRSHLFLLFKS